MIGAFSQNRVTLTIHLMISLNKNDLTYPMCGVSCYVFLGALVLLFIGMVLHYI